MQVIPKKQSVWGAVGQGLGKGLAESIPKELERKRLSSGLQKLSEMGGDMSQTQRLAHLYAIPGVTPQMIESYQKAMEREGKGNFYKKGQQEQQRQVSPQGMQRGNEKFNPIQNAKLERNNLNDIEFANIRKRNAPSEENSYGENVPRSSKGQGQINPRNPLNSLAFTRAPWSAEKMRAQVGQLIQENNLLPEEAAEQAKIMEQRELMQPIAYKAQNQELEDAQNKVRGELHRQLETKLQKKFNGEGNNNIQKDISGTMLINLERGIERDLVNNPNLSPNDAANKWSNRALNMVRAKDEMAKLANTTGFENLLPKKNAGTWDKIQEAQKVFKDADNLREFRDLLISEFKMSPQGASISAYPLSPTANKFVKSANISLEPFLGNAESNARKMALDYEKYITPSDSILAVAAKLKRKSAFFDEQAFFNQLSLEQNRLGLTEDQRDELIKGASDIMPHWGDIKILPWGH